MEVLLRVVLSSNKTCLHIVTTTTTTTTTTNDNNDDDNDINSNIM